MVGTWYELLVIITNLEIHQSQELSLFLIQEKIYLKERLIAYTDKQAGNSLFVWHTWRNITMLYFAQFHKNKNNQYEVTFPDLAPNAATYGDSLDEALTSAHDSLTGYLLTCQDFHDKVPAPSAPEKLQANLSGHDFLVPIKVNLKLAREKEQNKLVKKTLTIPEFVNTLGKEAGINFSAVLTEAVKNKLGIE